MTSAHSHPSRKAGFRLRKEGEGHRTTSKGTPLGLTGARVTQVSSLAHGPSVADRGHLGMLSILFSLNEYARLNTSKNTYGSRSLHPPSRGGSGRCNHWAGPGRCRRDGRGYCHIHLCRCHTRHLER